MILSIIILDIGYCSLCATVDAPAEEQQTRPAMFFHVFLMNDSLIDKFYFLFGISEVFTYVSIYQLLLLVHVYGNDNKVKYQITQISHRSQKNQKKGKQRQYYPLASCFTSPHSTMGNIM